MRVIALLAAYNEERFIEGCLEHLIRNGIDVYLLDNASTDATVDIASRYIGRGLLDIETIPRTDLFSWKPILERKEQLAAELDGDWFMHVDADEIRLAPRAGQSLADAIAHVDRERYNAVNFFEFTFTPTRESPDHDHPDFQRTMRWYYPFAPSLPHRLNAWKRPSGRAELAWSGGHLVRFPELRQAPVSFPMRHYLFLSVDHVREKYLRRKYDPADLERGWSRERSALTEAMISLPSEAELRVYESDDRLDSSNPRAKHFLFTSRRP